MLAHVIEHRADEALIETARGVDARSRQQVPRELLADELIEADIAVECADQIVTIFPRPFCRVVPFVSISICVADHVHPVPGCPLAKMWGLQEVVHNRRQRRIPFFFKPSRERLH